MSKLDTWIDNKVIQNLFIWFCLSLILMATVQTENRIAVAFFIILLLAPAVYINNLLILPLLRKKLLVFSALFILNTIVFTIISVFIIKTTLEQPLQLYMFINFFGILFLALAFASAIRIARDSFTRRQQEKEAELKLLKAQLNPHFLFNTLNNLYGLSVVKSEKLPDLMLKLSDLLRYSLYETKEMQVPLAKEVQYLENYISLEKIRLEDTTDIQFTTTGNTSSLYIAPMLFMVFVENAFKHLGGVENNKSRVVVSLTIDQDRLVFICENTMDPLGKEYEQLEQEGSGIGLQNVKKRLALQYPDMHELTTTVKNNQYKTTMTLNL